MRNLNIDEENLNRFKIFRSHDDAVRFYFELSGLGGVDVNWRTEHLTIDELLESQQDFLSIINFCKSINNGEIQYSLLQTALKQFGSPCSAQFALEDGTTTDHPVLFDMYNSTKEASLRYFFFQLQQQQQEREESLRTMDNKENQPKEDQSLEALATWSLITNQHSQQTCPR